MSFSRNWERCWSRQPEVSVVIQELNKRGWIEKRDLKKEGKGRPTHIYKATTSLPTLIKELEQQETKKIDTMKDNISKLKDIINNK